VDSLNIMVVSHEWLVIALGLGLLLVDLWVPHAAKPKLGYVAAGGLGVILVYSLIVFQIGAGEPQYAFDQMYALDGLALFFKRFFLVATIAVLLMSV